MKTLKILHKEHKGEKGNKFYSYFTPMTIDGTEAFTTIKLSRDMNSALVKALQKDNYLVEVEDEDISFPRSYGSYIGKDGKTKYPYIFITDLRLVKKLENKHKEQVVEFDLDEE